MDKGTIAINPGVILPWLTLISIVIGVIVKTIKDRYGIDRKIEDLERTQNSQYKEMDTKIDAIIEKLDETKQTQTEILKGLFASLEGHIEHGADGPVKEARNNLEDFLLNRK